MRIILGIIYCTDNKDMIFIHYCIFMKNNFLIYSVK